MKKIGVYFFLFILLGCSNADQRYLTESDINDLSRYAIAANSINENLYRNIIAKKLYEDKDQEIVNIVLEITRTLDTLAVSYMLLPSGRAQNGVLVNATKSGRDGYKVYEKVFNQKRVKSMLEALERKSNPSNKVLLDRLTYVISRNFLNESSYFNKQRLESRPYSILSLEVSLLETFIYEMLIEYIEYNEQKL